MIKMTLLLCGALYVGMMVLGQDHGQKRYGLLLAETQPKPFAQTATPEKTALFIPAQPVVKPAAPVAQAAIQPAPVVQPTPVVQSVAELEVAKPIDAVLTSSSTDALPAPEMADGLLYTVKARNVNVRGGPGRNFAVMDTVSRGDQVLVVLEDQPLEGWSRIRIEGDGIEGYVATKMLARTE